MWTLSHFPEDCGRNVVPFIQALHYVSRHCCSFMPFIMFNTKFFFNLSAASDRCSASVEHPSSLVHLNEYVVVGHECVCLCVCVYVCMCMSGLFLSACRTDARAQRREIGIRFSASQKREKFESLYFLQKGCLFLSCKYFKLNI